MAGVIAFSDDPDDFIGVAGWAHRLILGRAIELADDRDVGELEQAIALHGLFFYRLEPDQAARLRAVLVRVAEDLPPKLLTSSDPRDSGLARTLSAMKERLELETTEA